MVSLASLSLLGCVHACTCRVIIRESFISYVLLLYQMLWVNFALLTNWFPIPVTIEWDLSYFVSGLQISVQNMSFISVHCRRCAAHMLTKFTKFYLNLSNAMLLERSHWCSFNFRIKFIKCCSYSVNNAEYIIIS